MPKISVVTVDVNNPLIKPLRKKLGVSNCICYGMVSPLHKKEVNEEGLVLSGIPYTVSRIMYLLTKYLPIPQYYSYLAYMRAIDYVFARRVASDSSQIVYVNPIFHKTAELAKKKNKIVVAFAGNSEPTREFGRIIEDYNKFNIRHKYVYANKGFIESRKKTLNLADRIITISEVSRTTYLDANYNKCKLKLISLAGTDFPIQSVEIPMGKQRAFISTAFHNFIKGTHRLLLAWQKAQIKDIPLIIVGRICEDLQEFIDKYGPFDNVLFMGYVKGSLTDFYKQYDAVGVLLSFSEGAVRTTPELMSFGFPMIVSSDATCDIVKNGNNGFIVNQKNEEEIVDKLRWFAEDWERVHQMRHKVLSSVSHRTVKEYSEECADYLMTLKDIE